MSTSIGRDVKRENLYHTYISQFKALKKLIGRWYRPFHVIRFLKLFYILILVVSIKYGSKYMQAHYELFAGKADAILFSFVGGLALCGGWALILKIVFYFFRKDMRKKLPYVIERQQELLLLKHVLIDGIERNEGAPLTKPFENCPYPTSLKNTWKKHETAIHQNEIIVMQEDMEEVNARALIWFIAAVFIAVVVILILITFYLLLAVFTVVALAACLIIWFASNSPYPERDRYRYKDLDYKIKGGSGPYFDFEQTPSVPNKGDDARKMIGHFNYEIKNTKRLLKQWGYSVYDI